MTLAIRSNPLNIDRVELTLPNELSYLPLALLLVRETAKKFGFEGKSLHEIELATEEAAANAIEHAFEKGTRGTFSMICEKTAQGLRIIIKEQGIPFDPARIESIAPASDPSETGRGLGLRLMRAAMDQVSFHNLGREGKETHLVKFLQGRQSLSYPQAAEAGEEAEKISRPPPKDIALQVRMLDPAEAVEVSRCAYRTHGYSFFDDHIYYPERIVEMVNAGEMVSAVAVNDEGTVVGHNALVYPYQGAPIAEMTFAFVDEQYRGLQCANRLAKLLVDYAERSGLKGYFAFAVTNHVLSQTVGVKLGLNDCGILLATSPDTWFFKGIGDKSADHPQRISVVLSFKYLKPPPTKTIYAPPHHREMIEKLYRNIQGAPQFTDPADGLRLPREESSLNVYVQDSEGCAEILLVRPGDDVVHQVHLSLRDLCLRGISSIQLTLSLEDPFSPVLTASLEKIGFFFSGILPHTPVGDALILQYLNNVPFNYGKVMVLTDTAKALLNYVKQHDPNESLSSASGSPMSHCMD